MSVFKLPGTILNMALNPKSLLAIGGLSGYENYREKLKKEGKKPNMKNAYEHFGKPAVDRILKIGSSVTKSVTGKADGGMMNARKKNMGLKMADGGTVPGKFKGFSKLPESVQENMSPSLAKKYNKGGAVKKRAKSKPKARGTGAAIKGTKFKGVF